MEFVKFEDAIEKLGISAERLQQLREDGELRAYRDGSSWKFRADEIDRMAVEGVPEPVPPSDIGLPGLDDLVDARGLDELPDLDLEDDLQLIDEGEEQSELELELSPDDEDTVTTDEKSAADDEEGSADSILLSDETLGDSSPAAPSTIIGRSELKDADLDLIMEDEADAPPKSAGASNVLTPGGSGVFDSGDAAKFADIDELEIDLAAESAAALQGQDADALKKHVAQAQAKQEPPESDLALADVDIADDDGTDPAPAEEQASGKSSDQAAATSDLELATDEDDFVLSDASGSDITLGSSDSGINLVSPSDSGLALDDIPLEAGGSAILDSLSGIDEVGGESEISLMASDSAIGSDVEEAEVQTDDDFRLTPMGEDDDDGDSSSQVIALDAGLDDLVEEDAGAAMIADDAFGDDEGGMVSFEEEAADAEDFETGGAYAPVAKRSDSDYGWAAIASFCCIGLLLMFTCLVTVDLIRNMWSWDENLALNDSLAEGVLGLMGFR